MALKTLKKLKVIGGFPVVIEEDITLAAYENQMAINKLVMALKWLDERKKDRETRGVEGTSNA